MGLGLGFGLCASVFQVRVRVRIRIRIRVRVRVRVRVRAGVRFWVRSRALSSRLAMVPRRWLLILGTWCGLAVRG